MDSQTCRCREDCTSAAIFVCDCPDLYICHKCLVDHMKTAHKIESTYADEICGMIDGAIRNRENSRMNEFIEFLNSLLSKYISEVHSSSAWIKNEFTTKSRIITSIADSATKFLNKPLEFSMIRVNEETLSLFDAYFSTDLQRESILQYYALESIPSLKQLIHEKGEANEKLAQLIERLKDSEENARKQAERQREEYKGKITNVEEILEKRNAKIKKLTNDLEKISEQSYKESKKLKDEHTEKISKLEDIIEQRKKDIEELKDKLEEGGRFSERSQRNSDIIEQRNEESKKKDTEAEEGNEIIQKPCITQSTSISRLRMPVKIGVANRNEQKGNKDKVNDAIEKKFQAKDKDNEEINKLITQLNTKNNKITKLSAEIIALKEVRDKLINKNEKINDIVKKNIKELEQVRKENEDKFTELKAKDRESLGKINELKQIIKEKQEELTTQMKVEKTKIEELEKGIKQGKEALEKANQEHCAEYNRLVSLEKERKTINDREIQGLMQTLESNSDQLKSKDIIIEKLEQSINQYKDTLEKVNKERNVAHNLLESLDKEHGATYDREIQELKLTLENKLELLKTNKIRIEELEQSIKEYKEALEKVSADHNILVSLDKESKAKAQQNLIMASKKDKRIKELEQSIKECKEAFEKVTTAHNILLSRDKECNATNDREIQELKLTLENKLELLKTNKIRIEELEQIIKKGKEDLEKACAEYNMLVSLEKERKATSDRDIQKLKEDLQLFIHHSNIKHNKIKELDQTINQNEEALEKCKRDTLSLQQHAKIQEEYISQLSAAYQSLKSENESYAVLSRSILVPFQKFPYIGGSFKYQEVNQREMYENTEYLCLTTQCFSIVSRDREYIEIYNKVPWYHIYTYKTPDSYIKRIFASINEKFLIIEGSQNVYLLEILDCSRIEMRDLYEQEINYVMCNTDSTCFITYSDSVAIVLDLISMKKVAAVTLQLF